MKVQLTIDLGLSPKTKRWSLRLGIPALILGVGAIAYAYGPGTWTDGVVLTATDLNAAFANQQTQITALQAGLTDAGSQIGALQTLNATLQAGLADAGSQLVALQDAGAATQSELAAVPAWAPWALAHSAAAGACAAVATEDQGGNTHVVLPKPSGVACTTACSDYSSFNCATALTVGGIEAVQATSTTTAVAYDYRYACTEPNPPGEVDAGAPSEYAYCCCWH